MRGLFRRWLDRLNSTRRGGDEQILFLQREAQGLRLELEERTRLVTVLQGDLERCRREASSQSAEAIQTRMEQLLTAAASPVVQLLTQVYLLEVEQRPIQARDVFAVARRLIRVLEDEGLALEGRVGDVSAFDPNHHEPLRGEDALTSDQSVRVRFLGVRYLGKVIRKAGVEPAGATP